ncbi:L-threonylcarbamoyladenylate synthase [Rothia nasimurium]|uniref:L-threonylcarbamoyladenylate synthase n=1 Tax=Rothia nasimurium TaxID=85336 RepID=UPI003BA0C71D
MKATIVKTTDVASISDAVVPAIEAVGDGKTIVIPTDTVYGIAADAFSVKGVEALLAAKGRTRQMPPPVLIYDKSVLAGLADGVSEDARALADAFWPGALTLIFYAQPSLNWDLGDTQGTVALRVPDDQVAIELLMSLGPLAVSSANKTGRPAATTADEAAAQLGNDVEVIVDAGPRPLNRPEDFVAVDAQPSTIVDCTSDRLIVVREGAIPVENLRAVVPSVMTRAEYEAQEKAQQEALAAVAHTGVVPAVPVAEEVSPVATAEAGESEDKQGETAEPDSPAQDAVEPVSPVDRAAVVSTSFAASLVQSSSVEGIDQERPQLVRDPLEDKKPTDHLPRATAQALVFGSAPVVAPASEAGAVTADGTEEVDYGRGREDEEFAIDEDIDLAFAEPFEEQASEAEDQESMTDEDDPIEYPDDFEEIEQPEEIEEVLPAQAEEPVKSSRNRKKSSRRK